MELDGHLPLFAQFEDGGLIGFHVARGNGGDVFRPQTEIGEMAFRDEPQFQGLDPTTATHAENKGFARDVKVLYLFGHRAFGIPEYGMASGNRFRAVCVDNLVRPGEMAVEHRAGAAESDRFSGEQSGVEAADGVGIEDARMFLGGGLVKGWEAVYVRSGADHGLPAGDAGYAPGEAVRAPEMPRREADHVAAAF